MRFWRGVSGGKGGNDGFIVEQVGVCHFGVDVMVRLEGWFGSEP